MEPIYKSGQWIVDTCGTKTIPFIHAGKTWSIKVDFVDDLATISLGSDNLVDEIFVVLLTLKECAGETVIWVEDLVCSFSSSCRNLERFIERSFAFPVTIQYQMQLIRMPETLFTVKSPLVPDYRKELLLRNQELVQNVFLAQIRASRDELSSYIQNADKWSWICDFWESEEGRETVWSRLPKLTLPKYSINKVEVFKASMNFIEKVWQDPSKELSLVRDMIPEIFESLVRDIKVDDGDNVIVPRNLIDMVRDAARRELVSHAFEESHEVEIFVINLAWRRFQLEFLERILRFISKAMEAHMNAEKRRRLERELIEQEEREKKEEQEKQKLPQKSRKKSKGKQKRKGKRIKQVPILELVEQRDSPVGGLKEVVGELKAPMEELEELKAPAVKPVEGLEAPVEGLEKSRKKGKGKAKRKGKQRKQEAKELEELKALVVDPVEGREAPVEELAERVDPPPLLVAYLHHGELLLQHAQNWPFPQHFPFHTPLLLHHQHIQPPLHVPFLHHQPPLHHQDLQQQEETERQQLLHFLRIWRVPFDDE